jgi:4-hydroxy-2-oxoheptanedioate aldolase
MPRGNELKEKLAAGYKAVGCLVALPSADNAEILAHAGFDFLFIDHEHGPGSLADAVEQMRAIKATGTVALVRVPSNDPVYFKRILDAGADGVICPSVETAAEAESVVQSCFFPPLGTRGAGGGTRASIYGFDALYPAHLREQLIVAITIESARAVEHIGEIVNIAGIDLVFIGPRDLSASMGKLGQFHDAELLKHVETVEKHVINSGKYLASVVYPGLDVATMFRKGYHMVIGGTDVGFLSQGAHAVLSQPR